MIFWFHEPKTFSLVLIRTFRLQKAALGFFFLTFIFFSLQQNRGNLYGISNFISFAMWSDFSSELHVPTTVILVLR